MSNETKNNKQPIQNRYDFIYLFDVKDGNPNGDPDAGNQPRVDPETGNGLVTDVSLKRKVRNFIDISKSFVSPYKIFIREKAVLNKMIADGYVQNNIQLGEGSFHEIPQDVLDELGDLVLPEGLSVTEDESGKSILAISAEADKKLIKNYLTDIKKEYPKSEKFISAKLKTAKSRASTQPEQSTVRNWLCGEYFDIRAFGGVLSTGAKAGQVKGPIQFTFARSIDPVLNLEHSITRMAVTKEEDESKERTMGRKHTISYGLYRAHGFISAHYAADTGFNETDLELFWQALQSMWDHDRSAARGEMSCRGLYIFKHIGDAGEAKLGTAPAHKLFDLVTVKRKEGVDVPRQFSDYEVSIDKSKLGAGNQFPKIELIEY
jgi:CRISPR-associated protein Csd2